MLSRIEPSIYKANYNVTIEYHGSGFFVRKDVSYLIFLGDSKMVLFERQEGLRPDDNKYDVLFNECQKGRIGKECVITQTKGDSAMVSLTGQNVELLCMPSIFLENVQSTTVTEFAVDNRVQGTQRIYTLVYKHQPEQGR